MSEKEERDWTTVEAAEYLGVTDRSIRNWVRAGHFPNAYQKGATTRSGYRIPFADIVAFDERRRANPDDK